MALQSEAREEEKLESMEEGYEGILALFTHIHHEVQCIYSTHCVCKTSLRLDAIDV
jgi:hypothetical protein